MFLIKTADERFWKKDEPVLFLGEWCKLFSKKMDWQGMQQETLPYHWYDRSKLFSDYEYLQDLYERALADLALSLNKIHNENHTLHYWRIVLGPWLFYFIHVFYDRYLSIKASTKSTKVTSTWIAHYRQDEWVPLDYSQFSAWVSADAYNDFLYAWLIEKIKPFPFQYQDIQPLDLTARAKRKSLMKQVSKKIIQAYEHLLPHRFNQYVISSSYLSPIDQWRLQVSAGQWPSFFSPELDFERSSVNWQMRSKFSLSLQKDSFEKLLFTIIPQQMPKEYLEDFVLLKKQALAKYPAHPKIIATANDFHANEGFKIYAAEKVQEGTKLIGLQHGGTYGASLFNCVQEHEIKITDAYFTWGWQSRSHPHVKPLAAAKLNQFNKKLDSDPKGKVLLTLGAVPRYSYFLYSIFISSSGMLSYFDDQISFVGGLNESARRELSVRPFPIDFEWSQKERFIDEFPDIVFDSHSSLIKAMKASRLFIATYNSTTYLESFAANFPTIIFWNPSHWELCAEARPYFDRLRAAGILHDSPLSAAAKVNEIIDDPRTWWLSRDVQEAKDEFCSRFALTSEKWLIEWRQEFLNLARPSN